MHSVGEWNYCRLHWFSLDSLIFNFQMCWADVVFLEDQLVTHEFGSRVLLSVSRVQCDQAQRFFFFLKQVVQIVHVGVR